MGTDKTPSTTNTFEVFMRRVFTGEYECRHTPDDPVEPGEVVLGTLQSQVAKSMYSLWHEMGEGAKKFIEDLPEDGSQLSKDEKRKLQSQLHQYKNRIECAKSNFWEMVYTDFPKSRDPRVSVGIRSNWTVVIFKSSSPLELLMGGGFFG